MRYTLQIALALVTFGVSSIAQAASDTATWDRIEATISAPDAAPATTDFDIRVDGSIIGGTPNDIYAYGVYEDAVWSYSAGHNFVLTSGTPIDSSGFEFGWMYGATYTLNRPAGLYTYTFFMGFRTGASGWYDVAVEVQVTVGESCVVSTLSPITLLKGAKDGTTGAAFQWDADLLAAEYHLNTVTDKQRINPTDAHLPRTGSADLQCSDVVNACTDGDALIVNDPLLYYQVFAACGQDGDQEGPFE